MYGERYGGFASRALREEPTVRAGVARMLHEAAEFTGPSRPRGCLVISPAIDCTTPEAESALRDQRDAGLAAIEALVAADTGTGELPRGADARALARFGGACSGGCRGTHATAPRGGTRGGRRARHACLVVRGDN
ncbi:hypothetical protein GCM10010446_41580 [Streptomyces enissocaesilis]|uniref:Uncharacterized protein n=1 Tax=Streptomyces enissocaesilis TaxID=332589 RepID=A0ABP6JWG1_9ACTN